MKHQGRQLTISFQLGSWRRSAHRPRACVKTRVDGKRNLMQVRIWRMYVSILFVSRFEFESNASTRIPFLFFTQPSTRSGPREPLREAREVVSDAIEHKPSATHAASFHAARLSLPISTGIASSQPQSVMSRSTTDKTDHSTRTVV